MVYWEGMMRVEEKITIVAIVLVWSLVWAGVVVTAIHFIRKFW